MPGIWKGSITFGLVNVPVELRPAVREHRISFRMLHGKDNTPIRFERVRADTGEPVPWGDIVKGYEASKGQFVVLTEEDFEKAALEQSHTIDIRDFVDGGEIDPRFYEHSYFLTPGPGGDRVYALLRDAMAQTTTVGIGEIILHQRQHLVEIRAVGDALVLLTMRFQDELVDVGDYSLPARGKAHAKELEMAVALVEKLKAPFDASKYADEYAANVRRIIKAKAKGQHVSLVPDATKATREPKVLDLMARLRESLESGKRKSARPVPAARSGSTRQHAPPRRPRRRATA